MDKYESSESFFATAIAFALSGYRLPALIETIARQAGAQPGPALENRQRMGLRLSEMERWGLDLDALPAGSRVVNRRPSLWEAYRREVIGTLVAFALQALLIAALLRAATANTYEYRIQTYPAFGNESPGTSGRGPLAV